MVLEVTAKTDTGKVIPIGRKEYKEIGVDLDGKERLGAWQIKEVIDLSLQPRKTTKERFVTELPEDTKSAEIEVKVTYYPAPKTAVEVHKVTKKLSY